MAKLFLAYIRKSVIEGETASPARQRAAIERRIATAYPDARIEWYEDLDISGRHEVNRPDWQRLLQDLEAKGADGIAVESYDRSHRNVREFLHFYDTVLAPAGRTLISATQNLDLSTAQGRAMASVLMAFAELESRIASERMSQTIRYRIEIEGRHHGMIPFGCEHNEAGYLVPSQAAYYYSPATGEASAEESPGFEPRYYHDGLRAMFERYALGDASYTDMANYLNAAGWRGWERNRGYPVEWKREAVRSVLRRWELYAGRLPAVSLKWRPALPGGHEPILPLELCEAVGQVFNHRSKPYAANHSNRSDHTYILTGLLKCAACGRPMCGQANNQKRYFYRHRQMKSGCEELWISAPALESQIITLLVECVAELTEEMVAKLRQGAGELEADRGEVRELEAARAEMERLIDLRMKGYITEEEFAKFRAKAAARLEALTPTAPPTTGLEGAIDQLGELLGSLNEAKPALQKEIIHSLLSGIEAGGGQRVTRIIPQEWCKPLFDVACGLERGPSHAQHANLLQLAALLDC
jgi:site-specific DNA recombinase